MATEPKRPDFSFR